MNERLRWAALVSLLALTMGILIGALFLPPLLPPSGVATANPRPIQVTVREFDDMHTAVAVPELSDQVLVTLSGSGGMITDSSCTLGKMAKTGKHLLSVDGQARMAIVTDVPLWRDLAPGDRGVDVESLQRALVARGYTVPVSGSYDGKTASAVAALQTSAGVESTSEISLDRVQWVPAGLGAVTSCNVGIGTAVERGAPLLQVGGSLVGLTFPKNAMNVPGHPYVAVSGEAVASIDKDRRLTDPKLLAAAMETPAFTEWVADQSRGLTMDIRLAEPLTAIGIPPSAIVASDSGSGCVVTPRNETVRVKILTSELGTVFVVPEHELETVLSPATEVISTCD